MCQGVLGFLIIGEQLLTFPVHGAWMLKGCVAALRGLALGNTEWFLPNANSTLFNKASGGSSAAQSSHGISNKKTR